MNLHQKIKVSMLCAGLLLFVGLTGSSGEHKDHRHGAWGPHPSGINHPFIVPERYTGHRHGPRTHEVTRFRSGITRLTKHALARTAKPRKRLGTHKHGFYSH